MDLFIYFFDLSEKYRKDRYVVLFSVLGTFGIHEI